MKQLISLAASLALVLALSSPTLAAGKSGGVFRVGIAASTNLDPGFATSPRITLLPPRFMSTSLTSTTTLTPPRAWPPPGLPRTATWTKKPVFDPARAKALLKEASYEKGLAIDLIATDWGTPQMAAIGVKVNIKVISNDIYYTDSPDN